MLPVNTLHPIRNRSYVTYGLILVNALVFLWEISLSQPELYRVFMQMALVPCEVGQVPLGETTLDIFRSMFFHGSWMHLVGNMTFLWIFARNIEDYLGHRKFLLAYIIAGFGASFLQVLVTTNMCIPNIGASGAIAGVMGAFLVFYPGTRVRVMIIFFRFFPRFFDIPALLVLGYWFAIQLFYGFGTLNVPTVGGGIAFFAHIGGFVAGFLLAFVYTMFNRPPERLVYVD
jgi:membrane associated rhomboid family serine protease